MCVCVQVSTQVYVHLEAGDRFHMSFSITFLPAPLFFPSSFFFYYRTFTCNTGT